MTTSDEPADACLIAATTWALEGDAGRTEGNLRKAVAWAPRWHKPHWILAKLFMGQGRTAEADEEERLAVRYGGEPAAASASPR
jgi:Tfp pilus assembly protein PilF